MTNWEVNGDPYFYENRNTPPGYHQVIWDSRTGEGREIPSGIYLARLVTPAYTKSIKMPSPADFGRTRPVESHTGVLLKQGKVKRKVIFPDTHIQPGRDLHLTAGV